MNLKNKTTAELEIRDSELIRLTRSLSAWHNRNMSNKDRQFFAEIYRAETNAIIEELMSREKVEAN
jgi:hypothetical protein